ncbi:hypothetical protein KDB76_15395 [Pseudomonas sp. JS425]|nr:hypothetical protein KDB76_15395 [Pseudomonas sp. JS425]
MNQRFITLLQLLLELLQLTSLLRAQVAPGLEALCLHIQLPTHFLACTLRLGQDRAQALDLCITLLQQLVRKGSMNTTFKADS